MSMSERLIEAMAASGMSQAALARACGVKPPSVNGWLSGKSKYLRGENLLSAASALGVSQQWLATGEGEMRPSHATPNVKFSLPAEDQAPIAQALQALDARLKALAPVLQDSGREVLRKWAIGTATATEAKDALEALALASASMKKKD
jgi:transcriptional regulator with XRE-family HTH domain